MDVEEQKIRGEKKDHRPTVSLEFDKLQEIQDYYTPEEMDVSFKKMNKKNKKPKKTRTTTTLDVDVAAPVASSSHSSSTTNKHAAAKDRKPLDNFVDDDDLQQALAQTRKQVIRKKTAAEIAREGGSIVS